MPLLVLVSFAKQAFLKVLYNTQILKISIFSRKIRFFKEIFQKKPVNYTIRLFILS